MKSLVLGVSAAVSVVYLLGASSAAHAIDDTTYKRLETRAIQVVQSIDDEAKSLKTPSIQALSLDSQIVMNMPFDVVLAALIDGFKNLHETGDTGGDWDPETRLLIESYISGHALENEQGLAPKYAYVLFSDSRIRMGEYGNIFVVFKDHVKARTTWTPFDSFRLQDHIDAKAPRRKALQQGDLNTFQFAKSKLKAKWAYTEGQIWGPLDIRDVAEVVIPEEFSPSGEGATNQYIDPYARMILEKLVSLKVPISLMKESQSNYAAIQTRKKYRAGEWPGTLRLISAREEIQRSGELTFMHPELRDQENTQRLEKYVLPFLNCADYLSK